MWTSEELEIFNLFDWRCGLNPAHKAVTLHEILPKSIAPKTWMNPENRIPLCNSCHRMIHDEGSVKYRKTLSRIRQDASNSTKSE